MPRSRGAVSGFLLILLGLWGALIPYVGPYVDFAYTADPDWSRTAACGWLEVLPGVATAIGGLLLLVSAERVTAMIGGWLAVLAGAWFVLGNTFSTVLRIGSPGDPVAATDAKRALLEVAYFSGVGTAIVFLGSVALGRLAIVSARDVANAPAEVSPNTTTDVSPDTTTDVAPPQRGRSAPRRRGRGLFHRHRHRTGMPAAR
jgi:hypothetical protein